MSKTSILQKKSNNLITIKELFSDNFYYRIPDYQRGYAWRSDKEFLELWKDILRLYHSNDEKSKHYTGMITLDEIKGNDIIREELEGVKSFFIVDGQQRITSIVIILKTIFDYVKNNDIDIISNKEEYESLLKGSDCKQRFGYSRNRGEDDNYFTKRIYESNKNVLNNNQYFVNINNAQIYIERELDRYDEDGIDKILNIILNRLFFNVYFIADGFDVRVTFETMNNRGKTLTNLELLKNRLMFLSTYLPMYSFTLQKKINSEWKNIYDNLNYDDSTLSDDEYLKAHWIVYKSLNKKKGDAFIDDILNKEFSTDSGTFYEYCKESKFKEAFELLDNYVTSLGNHSEYWTIVNVPDKNKLGISQEELQWIKRLSRLPNNIYMKSAIMVVLASKNDEVDKISFYDKLEKFVFINKLLAQDKNDLSFLSTGARDLFNEQSNLKGKIDKLKASLDEHPLLSLNKDRIKNALSSFNTYIKNKEGFYYDWNGLRYFLYEYNDSLKIQSNKDIEWCKLSSSSIEHVLPQTPDKDYWKVAFHEYINGPEKKNIINSLGNLLLLSSGSENSSLRNYSYPVKRDINVDSEKFAYIYGSRSAMKIAENKYWTPKQIYDRTKELLKFLFNNWLSSSFFSEEDFSEYEKDLNNFTYYELTDEEYEKLTNELGSIDVSQERDYVKNNLANLKNEDYLTKQLLEYFDKDIFYLVSNSRNLRYIENRYSFVIDKNDDGNPKRLRIGTVIDKHKYSIEYDYENNNLIISKEDDKGWISFENDANVPDILKVFLKSLYRYIKKARQKEKPTFLQN